MTDQDFAKLHALRTSLIKAAQHARANAEDDIADYLRGEAYAINRTEGFRDYLDRITAPFITSAIAWDNSLRPTVKYPVDDTIATTDALNRLADAAERAANALDDLGQKQHGGINIRVCGSLAVVSIKPPITATLEVMDDKPQETISGMALASIIDAVKIAIRADKVRRGVAL